MERSCPGNLKKYCQWWHSFLQSLQERSRLFRKNFSRKNKPSWRMKSKSKKWRQTGRWFFGRGWNRARPNSAGNECRKCFLLCFILKQLPSPVLPECQPKINCAAKLLKMTAMKNAAKKIIGAKVAVTSCAISAPDRRETLPKWEPLKKFMLCNGLHKRSRNFR